MARRAATQASAPSVAETVAELERQDHDDAQQAQRQAQPLARRHALAEHQASEGSHEEPLYADDHRRDAGLDPERDTDEDPAEVEHVDEEAGDREVAHLNPPWPGRPRGQCDEGQ